MDDLRRAAAVVESVLKDPPSAQLFGEPVDPVELGLTDYYDVIREPADLGTILVDARSSVGGSGPFQSARDVANAVARVWSNCLLYNNRAADKPIRDAANRSRAIFEKQWAAAGLELPPRAKVRRRSDRPPLRARTPQLEEAPHDAPGGEEAGGNGCDAGAWVGGMWSGLTSATTGTKGRVARSGCVHGAPLVVGR